MLHRYQYGVARCMNSTEVKHCWLPAAKKRPGTYKTTNLFRNRGGVSPGAEIVSYLSLVTHYKFSIVGPDQTIVTKRPPRIGWPMLGT